MERKFDFISEYKVLSEGYWDTSVYTYGSDEPEYMVERGYIVKHNNHIFKGLGLDLH